MAGSFGDPPDRRSLDRQHQGSYLDGRFTDALEVMAELEQAGYKARLAGGCVRDRLLGRTPYDYDIVTDATPEQVIRSLKSFNHKVIPTGIAHGTVTALTRSCPIEITTLRRDVKTDGRRATVAFGADFEEDARRRDFTINALFEDKHGTIYDYVQGQEDIKNRVLRFVGDPSERIAEDALRVLRFFRFWARLGFEPAGGTIDAIGPLVSGLKKMSQERITSEILQLFAGPHLTQTLSSLDKSRTLLTVDRSLGLGLQCYLAKPPKLPHPLIGVDRDHQSLAMISLLLQLAHRVETLDYLQWGRAFKMKNADKKVLTLAHHLFESVPKTSAVRGEKLYFITQCQIKNFGFQNFFYPIWSSFLDISDQHLDSSSRQDLRARLEDLASLATQFQSLLAEKMPLDGQSIQSQFPHLTGEALGAALYSARISWLGGDWKTPEEGVQWLKTFFHDSQPKRPF